jgi:MraZ protein
VSNTSYTGYFVNAVDVKSRLSIPAVFRDVITARTATRQVVLGPGHAGRRCLVAYDETHSAKLKSDFDARHGASISAEAHAERAFLFGSTQTLGIDDAGRVVLPAGLKRAGGIGSHVLFVGGYEYFELWDPWTFMAHPLLVDGQRFMVEGELEARGLPLERPPERQSP